MEVPPSSPPCAVRNWAPYRGADPGHCSAALSVSPEDTTQHPLLATVFCIRKVKMVPFYPVSPAVWSLAAREARAHLLLLEGRSGWSLSPADGSSGWGGAGLGLEGRSPGFRPGLFSAPPLPAAGTRGGGVLPPAGPLPWEPHLWWGQVVKRLTDCKPESAGCW